MVGRREVWRSSSRRRRRRKKSVVQAFEFPLIVKFETIKPRRHEEAKHWARFLVFLCLFVSYFVVTANREVQSGRLEWVKKHNPACMDGSSAVHMARCNWHQRRFMVAKPRPSSGRARHSSRSAGTTINRNIYGHFAEHLGRCIYEGIWVGEDSPIPNTRGIRNDVVAALQAARSSRSCAGPAAASPTSTTGGTASARASKRPKHDQHALGRRRREQPLRHARVHGPVRAARRRAVRLRQRRQRHACRR